MKDKFRGENVPASQPLACCDDVLTSVIGPSEADAWDLAVTCVPDMAVHFFQDVRRARVLKVSDHRPRADATPIPVTRGKESSNPADYVLLGENPPRAGGSSQSLAFNVEILGELLRSWCEVVLHAPLEVGSFPNPVLVHTLVVYWRLFAFWREREILGTFRLGQTEIHIAGKQVQPPIKSLLFSREVLL